MNLSMEAESGSSENHSEFYEFSDVDFTIQKSFTLFCSTLMFLLILIGTFGNIISASIFTRRSMRSSINILLTGLAFVDLFVLCLSLPLFALPGLNAFGQLGHLAFLQMAIVFCLYQLAVTAQTCSTWTFVLITFERFFAVCYPLRIQRLFTAKKTKIAQSTVIALSVLYNLSRFWEYAAVYDDQGRAIGYMSNLRSNRSYFLAYYTISYLCVHFLFPFSIIALLNSKIARAVDMANRIRERLTLTHNQDSKRQRQITRMIIVVTTIFVACNSLPFILNLWEAVYPSSFDFVQNLDKWHSVAAYVTLEISNVLVVLNSSINFLIYLFYCRKYRRLFWIYCQKWSNRLWKRNTGSNGQCEKNPPQVMIENHRRHRLSSPTSSLSTYGFFKRFPAMSKTTSMNSFK